jgi:hypothetical protein
MCLSLEVLSGISCKVEKAEKVSDGYLHNYTLMFMCFHSWHTINVSITIFF